MLSGPALDLAFELRAMAGPLLQGGGPECDELRGRVTMSDLTFNSALRELQEARFVAIEDSGASNSRVIVLAPLQIYLDDLENQGSDDV